MYRQRPTSVTVFGILNIIFGAMGLCLTLMGVLTLVAQQSGNMPGGPTPPGTEIVQELQKDPVYQTIMYIDVALEFVATMVLIAAGIGLFMLKPWARIASILYSLYAILSGIVGIVVHYTFMFVPLMQEVAKVPPGSPQKMILTMTAYSGFFALLGLIYPVILLIFMYRPKLVAAFQPSAAVDLDFDDGAQPREPEFQDGF